MYINLTIRLNHKEWRQYIKKIRRKLIRQRFAQAREKKKDYELSLLLKNPTYVKHLKEMERLEEEEQRMEELVTAQKREEWFAKDLALHSLWCIQQKKKQEMEEEKKKEIDKIRVEWEKEQKDKKKQEEQVWILVFEICLHSCCCFHHDKNIKLVCELLQSLLEAARNALDNENETSNPEPPPGFSRREVVVEYRESCPFFTKTGTCRFGINCSRAHIYPETSKTILIPNMYSQFGLDKFYADDFDSDLLLEYEDSETYQHFKDFYYDVISEFKRYGRVTQFKVCCNVRAHLRGNVYVQYKNAEEASKVVSIFNGRWYAGKQLTCMFVTIEKWKSAICALFWQNECPKGKECNFLHVFRNPNNEFYLADKDIYLSQEFRGRKNENGHFHKIRRLCRVSSRKRESSYMHRSYRLRAKQDISCYTNQDENCSHTSKHIERGKLKKDSSKHLNNKNKCKATSVPGRCSSTEDSCCNAHVKPLHKKQFKNSATMQHGVVREPSIKLHKNDNSLSKRKLKKHLKNKRHINSSSESDEL